MTDFWGLVLAGALLWVVLSFRARMTRLERELEDLRASLGPKGVALSEAEARPAQTPWSRGAQAEAPVPPPAAQAPTRATDAPPSALDRLTLWLRDNWIYPVAGAALVLSGIFLLQYAIETGRMTEEMQIGLALALAALLTIAGEWLRGRPFAGPTLPATLTGAGLVIAMAAVLAALHLYAMIGPVLALVALAALSFAAIALGWLHGPMLSALGLVAGTAVPFLLGGDGPPPASLFGYFALLALAGMAIDARRRWGWVTWLAIAGPMGAITLWRLAGGDELIFSLAITLLAGAAMTIPFGYVMPVVTGPRALQRATPAPGVRASFCATALAAFALALLSPGLAGPVAIAVLAGLVAVWARRAPALADQMVLPLLAFPLWIGWQGWTMGPVETAFFDAIQPLHPAHLLILCVLGGAAYIWRGEVEDPGRFAPFTLAGLILPGGALVALETTWQPAASLGSYVWALHAMALAGAATWLALRYAARDAGQGPRLGAAASMAFALLAFALMLVLSTAALTVALAVLMVAAAAMDRRFDIPSLGAFQILGAFVLTWRLVVDPGLLWHLDLQILWRTGGASLVDFLLSLMATLAGPALALWMLQSLPATKLRVYTRGVLETTVVSCAAIAAALVIARLLPDQLGTHAQLGLYASALIVLAGAQARRLALPVLRRLRLVLVWGFSGLAGVALFAAAIYPASPLIEGAPFATPVAGWPVLNDLALAYLIPAILIWTMARVQSHQLLAWALAGLWLGSMIRHLWQGPDIALAKGIAQGELYAYTFALLILGALALGAALRSGRADLRKIGLALAGLAAAKAFLIDAAALDGLLRAGAFLGLGLSLAGLAWLNGWIIARETGREDAPG